MAKRAATQTQSIRERAQAMTPPLAPRTRRVGTVAEMLDDPDAPDQPEHDEPADMPDGADTQMPVVTNGGNGSHKVTTGMLLETDPDLILEDPDIKSLREWAGASRQELTIPELARMISEEGQKYPALVWEGADGYVMIDGQRRKEAIKLLQQEGEDVQLRVLVDTEIKNEQQAFRVALLSFTQHEDQTPIEFANSISLVRKKFDWAGTGGTARVAGFMGVSPATITQAERLLTLSDELQQQVGSGKLTPTAALELATSPAEKHAQVMEKAQEIADKEAAKSKPKGKKAGKSARAEAETALESSDSPAAASVAVPAAPAAPAPVKVRHVRQAQKQVKGAQNKPKAPRTVEIATLFEQWSGPGYPKAMSHFASRVVDYCHGQATDEQVQQDWDTIAAVIGGKPVKVGKSIARTKKTAKKTAKVKTAKQVTKVAKRKK